MPTLPAMPFPSFEAFYTAERPGLVAWLRKNKVDDPETVAEQAFLQMFKSKAGDPAAWTRAFLYRVVRGVLHRLGEQKNRLVIASLDVEIAGAEGDGVSLATQVAVPAAPDHGPVVDARLDRVKHELRRMPARMRAAFAIPTIYGKSNAYAADVLDRSVTRVDHLRKDARVILDATFGGGDGALVARLLLPTPDSEEFETPIRNRPTPRLEPTGRIEACLMKPRQFEEPPACHAIVHVVDTAGDKPRLFVSEPCPVEWIDRGDDRWYAQMQPRFDKQPTSGAQLAGMWLFAGDWLAGQ